MTCVKQCLGNDEYVNKLKSIPLSDTTIARCNDDMASDVRVQLAETEVDRGFCITIG